MNRKVQRIALLIVFILLAMGTIYTTAQDRDRRFDPERMHQMIMDRMKEFLGFEDEEWEVVMPLLERVWQMQREVLHPGMVQGLFRPGRGPSGRDDDRPGRGPGGRDDEDRSRPSRGRGLGPEPSEEVIALHEVVQDEDASADEIQEKLEAFREEKRKKQEELKKARDELREVLTVRQEAMLVLMGTLE